MTVRVLLFAAARELAGASELQVELAEGARVSDLRAALAAACPPLATVLAHARFAVDADFAEEQSAVLPGTEIACIPPVSGG